MSLLLAAVTLLILPQEPTQARPSGQVAATWWEQLSPEQRERLNERWHKYREYGPDSQAVLQKRFDALEDERSMLFRRLSEPERQSFEAMDDASRRRFLDERLRERYQAKAEHWQGREPGLTEGLRDLPPAECSRRLEGFARQVHGDRVRGELETAVNEGWIGSAAAEWLRQAPAEELFTAVGQVHRWRFLERAHRENFWTMHGIGSEERSRMLELPIPHFFEEVRRLQQGEPLLAPPCDWRRDRQRRGFDRDDSGGEPREPRSEKSSGRPPRERPDGAPGERPPGPPQH